MLFLLLMETSDRKSDWNLIIFGPVTRLGVILFLCVKIAKFFHEIFSQRNFFCKAVLKENLVSN